MEIVIVDQSDNFDTKNLVNAELSVFFEKRISLKYMWEATKSITHARNVGARAALGNIVFFLDDDMIVHKHYVREILKVFKNNPSACGVQGCLFPPSYWEGFSLLANFVNIYRRAFLLTHLEKNTQRVLLSGEYVVAYPLDKTIEATIIYPAMSAFKREVLFEFPLDEKLSGFSWGDEYFTVKLSKLHPNCLFVTPFATAFHDMAPHGRPTGKRFHYSEAAYQLYNFDFNLRPSFKNWVAYFWKLLGRMLLALPDLRSKDLRMRLIYTFGSYSWALRNFDEVRAGRFNL